MAEQNNSYPMISEKSWWILRDKFKSTLPSSVSNNYVKTLLTLGSDASAISNVISPLKRLGLIDDDNKPTSLANEWRLDDSYKKACTTMLKNVYPNELMDLFSDEDIDRNQVESWFMGKGVGEKAAKKMSSLFILLKGGEIKSSKDTSSHPKKSQVKKTSTQNKNSEKQAVKQPKILNVNGNNDVERSAKQGKPDLHIDLQIHISPDSTPEQIEAIFASMAKHLYGVDN